MTDLDNQYDTVRVGDRLREFKSSKEGKFLWKKADDDAEWAKEELSKCDPTDSKLIMELQNKVEISRLFKAWISEGIQSGDNTFQQLKSVEV